MHQLPKENMLTANLREFQCQLRTWLQLAMLHLLHQACRLWAAQQAFHIPQPRAKAHSADSDASAKTLRAFCELICVLCPLPVQCPPLPSASTHIAGRSSAAKALQAFVLLTACGTSGQISTLQYLALWLAVNDFLTETMM